MLTLTEKPIPEDLKQGSAMEFLHISMKDHGVPSLENLDEGAGLIQREVARGRRVLVHCLAGEGRTGSVLAAYLIKDKGMTAGDALKTLRALKPAFVEWAQEKAVYDYAASLK